MKKKLISMLLALVMCMALCVPAFATDGPEANDDTATIPIGYERAANALTKAGIQFMFQDNQLKLVNPSPENIQLANEALKNSFQETYGIDGPLTRAAYPTPWVSNPVFDHWAQDRFEKATKTALTRTIATVVGQGLVLGTVGGLKSVAATFVTNFLLELYETRDEVVVYYEYTYHYREYGPGWVDSMGNFYGEYENRERVRMTTDPDLSGGEVYVAITKDTQVLPM